MLPENDLFEPIKRDEAGALPEGTAEPKPMMAAVAHASPRAPWPLAGYDIADEHLAYAWIPSVQTDAADPPLWLLSGY